MSITSRIKHNELLIVREDAIQRFRPESDLELKLLCNESFLIGLNWGFPRYGHPEGKVIFHVQEVLENIEKIKSKVDSIDYSRLRLIAMVHDTFKYKESKKFPRDWSRHHSIFARDFMAKYTDDQVVLNILELHDEAYYTWRIIKLYQEQYKGAVRKQTLLDRLGDSLQLYYLFFKCDTQTGDKIQAPIIWFEKTTSGIEIVNF